MAEPFAADMPDDLLSAFQTYEAAVVANDLDQLDAAFAPGSDTLRGDGAGLLVGHETISAFRGGRGGINSRAIERVEYRRLGNDAALLVSVSRFASGGTGLQTQLWQRIGDRWLISAAHVTPRQQAFDRSVWRTVGDPLRSGAPSGPLAGLTVAVKDVFALAGDRIGAGNPTYLAAAPVEPATAPAVAVLLEAGAALRGIARTDEFAYSIAGENTHYGTPPNGAVPGALPGGSSSGPATAVALGQADVGLATDTAGSIRVPASYQGLWGLRTTHDRVSRDGLLPLAPSFDTVGWITRDGATIQKVAAVGLTPDPATDAVRMPVRLVVPDELVAEADPATRAVFEALLVLVAAHIDVSTTSIGVLDAYAAPFRTVQSAEAWRSNGAWLRAHRDAIGPNVAERFRAAADVTATEEGAARAALIPLRDRLRDLASERVLIAPTVPGPAPARGRSDPAIPDVRARTLRMTTPAAVAGLPTVSVPLLTVSSALGPAPVGVSLIGPAGSDIALVALACQLADAVATAAPCVSPPPAVYCSPVPPQENP
ncbi:DUF3225 domain-containing protein [Microbacterium lacus]|uniref:AtzH-like domain-containing protein n=1 Tax=Microbacterium lacus TaxID=415217 RepID=UPI00384B8165